MTLRLEWSIQFSFSIKFYTKANDFVFIWIKHLVISALILKDTFPSFYVVTFMCFQGSDLRDLKHQSGIVHRNYKFPDPYV